MGTVLRMVPNLLLLVISTALAAPRGPQDSMEGSEDNSDNSVDYSGGSEDNFTGNSTDYLDEAILERSNSLLEDRAINMCGCAPVSTSNRIVGGKEVNPKGKLPYQVLFQGCAGMRDVQFAEAPSSTRGSSSLQRTATTQCSLRCTS